MWWHKTDEKEREPKPTLEEQLVDAKAKLARYEQLPEEDFTLRHPRAPIVLRFGVDEKPKAIARVKAEIAELEVKLTAVARKG